jgi:hypothetical protein
MSAADDLRMLLAIAARKKVCGFATAGAAWNISFVFPLEPIEIA